jgi:hypothetical protein
MMRLPRDGIREEDPRLAEADRWDTLVRRIMGAADPELARLRARRTLGGQVGEWTRPLLPLAALLILAFGSLLAWVGTEEVDQTSDTPLMAEVLLPSPLVFWVGAGARLTLDEIVEALEAGTR